VSSQPPLQLQQTEYPLNPKLLNQIDDIKATDLDQPPKPSSPQKTLKLRNYKIYRQDEQPSINSKLRRGLLIAVHKDIPTEDTPQPTTSNIEILNMKIKTTPILTVGAAYFPPLAVFSSQNPSYLYAKHIQWNNTKRNLSSKILSSKIVPSYTIIKFSAVLLITTAHPPTLTFSCWTNIDISFSFNKIATI
ncbi:unnamed protein product, partial [Heterotrigona itama]